MKKFRWNHGRFNTLVRGHLSEQTLKPKRASGTTSYGPYYTLQRHENGTNNCQRIGPDELEFIVSGKQGAFYSIRQNALSCRDE